MAQDLLTLLSKNHNFTRELLLAPDGKVGGIGQDGLWNGMVGMLLRDEADIISSPLTQTPLRSTVINFTVPIEQEVVTLIAPLRKGVATNFWVYSHIFSKVIWGLVFLAFLLVGMASFLLERLVNGQASILSGLAASGLLFLQLGEPPSCRKKCYALRMFYLVSN